MIYKMAGTLKEKGNLINQKNKVKNYRGDYVKNFVNIILFAFVVLFSFATIKVNAAESYIYFDLNAGNVTITSTTYTGYVFKTTSGTTTTQTISGTHSSSNKYYVYQSNSSNKAKTGLVNGSYVLPTYSRVKYNNQSWAEFIKNHPSKSSAGADSVDEVITAWGQVAHQGTSVSSGAAYTSASRQPTPYYISVEGKASATFDITVDSVWSSYWGSTSGTSYLTGISYMIPNSGSTNTNINNSLKLYFKGDNRLGRIHAATHDGTNMKYNDDINNTNIIYITGDSDATLTLGNLQANSNKNNTAGIIGGTDSNDHTTKIDIKNLNVYAGSAYFDYGTGIGGGGNGYGIVTIDGNATVTAITSATGTAIGGGCGTSGPGGGGEVTIKSGNVYAYSYKPTQITASEKNGDVVTSYTVSTSYSDAIPTAIGGGSSGSQIGGYGKVDISGGNVFAYSEVGNAIGGGGGGKGNYQTQAQTTYQNHYMNATGGDAKVTISGGTIRAVSTGTAIGGGPGGGKAYDWYNADGNTGLPNHWDDASGTVTTKKVTANGGKCELNITGGTIYTGSIGGGTPKYENGSDVNKHGFTIGAAQVTMTDGFLHGQVVMEGAGSSFDMSGGIVNNTSVNDGNNYKFVKYDGGAVHVKTGNATLSGGTIQNCSADDGGAIYVNGGDFELSGTGKITNCNATNGGAVFVSGGNAYINGGTITSSEATNGGAVGVSGGNLTLSGGTITSSEATTGGAVYVAGGNMTITGGTIANSKATNGGGVYISNGNITMDGGTISNNQAQEYGGGIYAYSNTTDLTLTISSGSIIGNIASKNGGGVGVNMGTGYKGIVTVGLEECLGEDETHSHPIIKDNTATEYGGGFWLNGDSMTMNMYCGSIEENIAILEAGSSNIYQTGGNATVHAGTVGEGVIVIGGEYIYIPENQLPKLKIIYDSNNSENQQQTEAYVTEGVEIYLPKNTFTKEGFVLYGWSTSKNPSYENEIYLSGAPYTVTESVTIYAVWKKEGSGEIQVPIIASGKQYNEITGGTNMMLSQDSAFTVQMSVLNMQPSLYKDRTLIFDKNLENGTNITMIDFSDSSSKKYYYYKVVNDETKSILLSEFAKNGTAEKYENNLAETETDEILLFIVELPKDSKTTGAMQMSLKRESADNEIAPIEQSVTYITTEQRTFDLTYNENISIQDTLNITYQTENPVGEETRYTNKNISLVIKGMDNQLITEESRIFDGTNYYNVNSYGEFIIPVGAINNNKEIDVKLISKSLEENELNSNLKFELWSSDDEKYPYMGNKVAEFNNIELNSIVLPAIKVDLSKKAYIQEDFTGDLKLEYEAKELDNCNATIEFQKKVASNSYVTQTNLLTAVDGNSENTNGVFNLDLNSSGTIDLEFAENLNEQDGTYRILMKLKNGENISYDVPVNFMLSK